MSVDPGFDVADFAERLVAMTDDEIFRTMQDLEAESERMDTRDRETTDVFAKIELVQTTIEDRFPGQRLAAYRDWRQRRTNMTADAAAHH